MKSTYTIREYVKNVYNKIKIKYQLENLSKLRFHIKNNLRYIQVEVYRFL